MKLSTSRFLLTLLLPLGVFGAGHDGDLPPANSVRPISRPKMRQVFADLKAELPKLEAETDPNKQLHAIIDTLQKQLRAVDGASEEMTRDRVKAVIESPAEDVSCQACEKKNRIYYEITSYLEGRLRETLSPEEMGKVTKITTDLFAQGHKIKLNAVEAELEAEREKRLKESQPPQPPTSGAASGGSSGSRLPPRRPLQTTPGIKPK